MNAPTPVSPRSWFDEDTYCPRCAYNLRGATGDRCPECGAELAAMLRADSSIPWVRRRAIGRVRAYLGTVWLVVFRHRQFCESFTKVVSYADARRFQFVTVALTYLPFLAGTVALYDLRPPNAVAANPFGPTFGTTTSNPYLERAYGEVWPVGLMHLGFILFLLAATGVPSYFFHPRSLSTQRQNSAIALSLYCCAPLLGVYVVAVLACAALLFDPDTAELCVLASGFAMLATLLAWWGTLGHLMLRLMPPLRLRVTVMQVALPAIWSVLAILLVIGLPLVIVYVLIVFASLRP